MESRRDDERLPLISNENNTPDFLQSESDDEGDKELTIEKTDNIREVAYSLAASIRKSIRGPSLIHLRSSSMSISMLAKPSDDRKAGSILAGWNVSNLIQGTGILGVPYAVQQGGWAAVAMIIVVAVLCCHTGKLLINCMYEQSKKTGIKRRLRVNYPEVAEAVWGPKGLTIVGIIQCIEMFGGAVMYLILLGATWHGMFKNIVPQLGVKEWSAINCLVALPSLFITKMSILSWFSMISVFSLMSSLLVMIAFCFTQVHQWRLDNIPPFDAFNFPVGFGIIVFSYTAHAVFPSIEGSMRKPEQFNSMMNGSFFLAIVVKTCLGLFMVLTYGIATNEVATVNLSNHPTFLYIATGLVIGSVLLAIPLGMFIVSATFDDTFMKYFPRLNRDSEYHWMWLIMTRPLLSFTALFLAVIVPHFGLLMGVVGNFTGTCLCFVFPCWFHMKLRWNSLSNWEIAFEFLIIIFGVVAGGLGFVFSLKALIDTMIKDY